MALVFIPSSQGPRSNFKIGEEGGGGTFSDSMLSILGGHKTLFLTNSFFFSFISLFTKKYIIQTRKQN